MPLLVQNAVKAIGIEHCAAISMDQDGYYGDGVFGKSNWLDSVMGITDYGHRGVPNVYLTAPLTSERHLERGAFQERRPMTGWRPATSPRSTSSARRRPPARSSSLLLDETPVIWGYFYDFLTATVKGVTGVQATAMSQIYVDRASKA